MCIPCRTPQNVPAIEISRILSLMTRQGGVRARLEPAFSDGLFTFRRVFKDFAPVAPSALSRSSYTNTAACIEFLWPSFDCSGEIDVNHSIYWQIETDGQTPGLFRGGNQDNSSFRFGSLRFRYMGQSAIVFWWTLRGRESRMGPCVIVLSMKLWNNCFFSLYYEGGKKPQYVISSRKINHPLKSYKSDLVTQGNEAGAFTFD